MGRIEYKYLVPNSELERLRSEICMHLRPDKYAVGQPDYTYTVRSIYYDTAQFDFYNEKIEGLRKRKKIRIRGYNCYQDGDRVFLEIKRKNDSSISKNRAPVPFEDLNYLIQSGDMKAFSEHHGDDGKIIENAERFLFHVKNLALEPVVLIVYEREAYHYRFNDDLRITFDKNLRSSSRMTVDALFRESNFISALRGSFILEVKTSGNFPSWLSHAIASLELRRKALSKYTICLDSHFKKELRKSRAAFIQKRIGSFVQESPKREVA